MASKRSDDNDDDIALSDEFDFGMIGASSDQQFQVKDDTIAESLYSLVKTFTSLRMYVLCPVPDETLCLQIGEVFDMRGVFRWLRKSLMTFVQITYGRTINRQIRDTVDWITSEQMIIFYLNNFKKAFWDHEGTLKPRTKVITICTGHMWD